jgi:hypothetical protein
MDGWQSFQKDKKIKKTSTKQSFKDFAFVPEVVEDKYYDVIR